MDLEEGNKDRESIMWNYHAVRFSQNSSTRATAGAGGAWQIYLLALTQFERAINLAKMKIQINHFTAIKR